MNSIYSQISKIVGFLIIIISASPLFSQVVYTPVNSDIYEYLNRMSLKRIIEYHDEVLPLSRKKIAGFLQEIKDEQNRLNDLEQKELKWYYREYAYELGKSKQYDRLRLFNHTDSLFQIKVSPRAGYLVSNYGGESGYERKIGMRVFATYSDWFGMQADISDYGEFGDNVDEYKGFNPSRKAWYKQAPNGVEYSDVIGSINFNWDWGSVSLAKNYMKWGHGNFGQLILSDNAPSFPYIKLDLQPNDWFRFHYFHGQLTSMVIDSSESYYTESEIDPLLREEYVDKFIVGNILGFTPFRNIDISIGNSFIYSGKLRTEMFIPFMFYKLMDHNTGRGRINDGNGQLFFDAAVKYPETFRFYGTLFIETISIREILDRDLSHAWIAYTLGVEKTGLYFDNFSANLEYTLIRPWIYEHKDKTTDYKHVDYILGHWIGQNADQLKLKIDYRVLHNLDISFTIERLRKGALTDIGYAYGVGDEEEAFLYGLNRKDFKTGFDITYQPLHELFIRASYGYFDVDEEDKENPRTPDFMKGANSVLKASVFYGL